MSRRKNKNQQRSGRKKHGKSKAHGKGGQKHQGRGKHHQRGQHQRRTFLGRVQKNPRGFAFLLPLATKMEDVYVSKEDAASLLPDDLVEFSIIKDGRRSSADIIRIVERSRTEVLGRVDLSNKHPIIFSLDNDIFFIRNPHRLKQDDWLIGKIEKYPSGQQYGEVSIVEHIGQELKPKFDYRIAIAQFGLENEFPRSAEAEAEKYDRATEEEIEAMLNGDSVRRDLRSLPFVTIDGETAKDFDDAICVIKDEKKNSYKLYVAIADVSFFVRPGSPLDKAARARATSVYFPGFCLPMLPEKLSNGLCSLRPQEPKLTLTAEIHYDRNGHVTTTHFYASLIQTVQRLTYTEVHAYAQKEKRPQPALEVPMKHALELYNILRKDRKTRGVLDFDLPETEILVDKEGWPECARRAPRFEAHQLIEEFMIAANRAVAKALKDENIPALYRVHERPSPEAPEELNMLMRNLGINLRLENVTPLAIAKILDDTAHLPQAKTLHQFILRLQKQARYEPYPKGHFGLALEDYAHFTSPIRRYPDLVVHRALKALINYENYTDNDRESENLEELGLHTSTMERRAMEAERFVVKRKQCWFMSKKVGEIFDANVSGVIESGIFVEIPQFAVEGFIPLDQLGGYFVFDERRLCLRARPGHTVLTLGDSISVQLVRVSMEENRIEFVRYLK